MIVVFTCKTVIFISKGLSFNRVSMYFLMIVWEAEGCFQEKEDIDKPRLAAKLQKVLQLYAATVLYKRSYAKKGTLLKSLAHSKLPLSTNRISSRLHPIIGNQVVKAEHFLETLIKGLFIQPYFTCSQSTQRSSHLVYYVFPAPEEQWNKFFLEG